MKINTSDVVALLESSGALVGSVDDPSRGVSASPLGDADAEAIALQLRRINESGLRAVHCSPLVFSTTSSSDSTMKIDTGEVLARLGGSEWWVNKGPNPSGIPALDKALSDPLAHDAMVDMAWDVGKIGFRLGAGVGALVGASVMGLTWALWPKKVHSRP